MPTLLSYSQRRRHKEDHGLCNAPPEHPPEHVPDDDMPVIPVAVRLDEAINDEAFAKDLVLLVVNQGVSWKGAEHIVKLVNHHVHNRTLVRRLPASAYQLKKITQCRSGHAKLLDVCPACDFVFDGGQPTCAPCNLPPRTRVKRQLLINDVGARIRKMFSNPMLAEAFEYGANRRSGDGDVWDGRVMRDIPIGTLIILHIITLNNLMHMSFTNA
jgi:hypothetical protein